MYRCEQIAGTRSLSAGTGAVTRRSIRMPRASRPRPDPDELPLNVAVDKVAYIVMKARAFDAEEGDSDPDSGSNPADDGDLDVLEDTPDNPSLTELRNAILGLNGEEQIHLVALAWLGRGTFDLAEWREALDTARKEHNNRTAEYLTSLPLLGDYLEEGLAQFGETIVDEGER